MEPTHCGVWEDLWRTFAMADPDFTCHQHIPGSTMSQEGLRVFHGLGRHPIPVIVLARLAVDHHYQGKGLGSGLLKDALLRVLEASDIVGVRVLLVHAKDERARDFYQRFGFLQSPTDPLHLYLSLANITASLK